MIAALIARLRQKHRTMGYPDAPPPAMPDRFNGRPVLDQSKCARGCRECVAACPVGALSGGDSILNLDLGRCLYCGECAAACPHRALTMSRDHRLAARKREDLAISAAAETKLAEALESKMKSLFGRSLKLRQVSAGGCNACEADANVLTTLAWDLSRFGFGFVASPRHADGLLITGPISENMRLAPVKTYEAVPAPNLVIAVGSCAISGGPYVDLPDVHNGARKFVPVDLYIPGCPPHPLTILDGLLRLLGRLPQNRL